MDKKLPAWSGKVELRTMTTDESANERLGVVGLNSFSDMMGQDNLPQYVDLSFYNYASGVSTIDEHNTEERKSIDNGIKLLRMIKSSFQDIPNQILESEQEIEPFILNVYAKNSFDRQDEWISNAFNSDLLIDKFFDWLMELLVDTTTSKLIYLLDVITVNKNFKNNMKRRHLIRLCNYIFPYEKFEVPFNLYFGKFLMTECLHLSWNVLETVLLDETKTTKKLLPPKERNKRGAQVLFESRCIDCLTSIATSNEVYLPKLLEIFEEILETCDETYLISIIIADMKALKLINKSTFIMIEREYSSRNVFEDITGPFFEFCQQVDKVDKVTIPSLLNKKSSVEESKAKKRVRRVRDIAIASIVESGFKMATSAQFSDFQGEFNIDSKIYSVEKMFEHLKEVNLLRESQPSIERVAPETESDKADFTKVSLMLLRFDFYSKKKVIKKGNQLLRVDDIRESTINIIESCVARGLTYFTQLDYQPLIDYILKGDGYRMDDVLYFLAMAINSGFMIIERTFSNSYTLKPLNTYLVDIGMIERLEQIIMNNVNILESESEYSKSIKTSVIQEAVGLISELLNNSDLGRTNYLIERTNVMDLIISVWVEFLKDPAIREASTIALNGALKVEKLVISFIYDKYFLAAIVRSFDILKQYQLDNEKESLVILDHIFHLVQKAGLPGIVKSSGVFPKTQRKIIQAMEQAGIIEKVFEFLQGRDFDKLATGTGPKDHQLSGWSASLATFLAYLSRNPPSREHYYLNDFKLLKFLIKEVIFTIHDQLSKYSVNNLPEPGSPLCGSFINYLSVINHILWDIKACQFLFEDVNNRSSKSGLSLENMCFFWLAKLLEFIKRVKRLNQAQTLVFSRTLFCISCLMGDDSFCKTLLSDSTFLSRIMEVLKFLTTNQLMIPDINLSSIKIISLALRNELSKGKINVDTVLGFIVVHMDGSGPVDTLFYDLIGSQFGAEAEKLINSKYSILRKPLKDCKKQVDRCASCRNLCGEKGEALKSCSRCGKVKYCCKQCQVKDWPTHKLDCTKKE